VSLEISGLDGILNGGFSFAVADFASHMFLVTGIFKEQHNICCCPPGEPLKTGLKKYLFHTCRWFPCCWSHGSKLCHDRKREGELPFLCTTMNGFFVCAKRPQLEPKKRKREERDVDPEEESEQQSNSPSTGNDDSASSGGDGNSDGED
jgi:hypothetical protein